MNTQNLLVALAAQDKNLELLIESLQNQKSAIMKNDLTLLDKAVLAEQKIIGQMEKEELARKNAVQEIASELKIEMNKNSIDELLAKCKTQLGKDYKKIETLRIMIREKLQIIVSLNAQLKNVLDFSRNLIKETLLMIAGPNKNAIVNKRV